MISITLGITTHNMQLEEPICIYKSRIDLFENHYLIMPTHINIIANNTGMETTKMPIKKFSLS